MTRVNVVPPAELCDQHLLAEHRELTRVPNAVACGRYSLAGQPGDYTLGPGHVWFLFDRLLFLANRYAAVHAECLRRGFAVAWRWRDDLPYRVPREFFRDYQPTANALAINRARIADRTPKAGARFSR